MGKIIGMSIIQNNKKFTSVTIPKTIVDALKIEKGEKVIFEVVDKDTIIIKR